MQKEVGKAKREHTPPQVDKDLEAKVHEIGRSLIGDAYRIKEKLPRYAAIDAKAAIVNSKKQTLSLRHVRAKFPQSSVTSSTTWFASA